MSYDISIVDEHGAVLHADTSHQLRGGTYVIGGTTELSLNVTYNYAENFHRFIDSELGIRWLYGKRVAETLGRLWDAADKMNPADETDNYWDPTEGNARRAIINLALLGEMAPDGIWSGD